MNAIKDQFRGMVVGWPLAVLRIVAGYMFLQAGLRKVKMGADWVPGMQGFVNRHLEAGNVYGFFRPFMEGVVMKAPALFAYMVAWGELFLGIALILGVLTRLSSYLGAFMIASFLFTKGSSLTLLSAGNYDTLWVLVFLVFAICGAGRVLGVDRVLMARFGPKPWLW